MLCNNSLFDCISAAQWLLGLKLCDSIKNFKFINRTSNLLCMFIAVVLKWVIMPLFDTSMASELTFMTWSVMLCIHSSLNLRVFILYCCTQLTVLWTTCCCFDSVNSNYFTARKSVEFPLLVDIANKQTVHFIITHCHTSLQNNRSCGLGIRIQNNIRLKVWIFWDSRINGTETAEWIELIWEQVYKRMGYIVLKGSQFSQKSEHFPVTLLKLCTPLWLDNRFREGEPACLCYHHHDCLNARTCMSVTRY